jgi:hypothetical protein
MSTLQSRQFTLRAILLAATLIPPLVGGFCGALGEYVQLWLMLAIGIPALALAMLGATFALCYLLLVAPVLVLAQAIDYIAHSVRPEK